MSAKNKPWTRVVQGMQVTITSSVQTSRALEELLVHRMIGDVASSIRLHVFRRNRLLNAEVQDELALCGLDHTVVFYADNPRVRAPAPVLAKRKANPSLGARMSAK